MADGYGGAAFAGAPKKFIDPDVTADGSARAEVPFTGLETLWVNTGTLCNIECAHCYIESSPQNDRLAYLAASELRPFLDDAKDRGAKEIGFTGGEPFLNPDMIEMTGDALARGFSVLILTNAMRPMQRPRVLNGLKKLRAKYGTRLRLRVSIDHYTSALHDEERTQGSFEDGVAGLQWLAREGFQISVAGRMLWGEEKSAMQAGYQNLFSRIKVGLNAYAPEDLVLFPEMDERGDTPEISSACWEILGKDPREVMCANARMLVKRKGANAPTLLACTLIPYDAAFEMGATIDEASRPVKLNHPHCSKFCVLGGASCSG